MDVIVKKTKQGCSVVFSGELTIYNAESLREKLLALDGVDDPVVFDLKKVSELDSSGMQLLLVMAKSVQKNQLVIKNVQHSECSRWAFDLYDFDQKFFNDQVA